MKKIAIRFNWKGEKVVWYPIQTLIAIGILTFLIISPMIKSVIETNTKNFINYIENNYEVDNKGTLSVYDDSFVRK